MATSKKVSKQSSKSKLHFDKFIIVVFAVLSVGLVGAGYLAGSQAAKPTGVSTIVVINEGVKFGEYVKVATSYPNNTKVPVVGFSCYQNGVKVWGINVGPAEASNPGVKLGSDWSPWKDSGGGPAQCEVYLWDMYWKGGQQYRIELAKTTFNAQ